MPQGYDIRPPRFTAVSAVGGIPRGWLVYRKQWPDISAAVTAGLTGELRLAKPIAPASPWQNGFVERLIGSIRRECVDHIIVLGETHLRRESYLGRGQVPGRSGISRYHGGGDYCGRRRSRGSRKASDPRSSAMFVALSARSMGPRAEMRHVQHDFHRLVHREDFTAAALHEAVARLSGPMARRIQALAGIPQRVLPLGPVALVAPFLQVGF